MQRWDHHFTMAMEDKAHYLFMAFSTEVFMWQDLLTLQAAPLRPQIGQQQEASLEKGTSASHKKKYMQI